jgi:hypothetical protein
VFPICSEFCQVVFPQPGRIINRFQVKHGFNPSPEAGSLVSLVHELKSGALENVESCLSIAAVKI